jgi:type IV pilus assembly protein PilN
MSADRSPLPRVSLSPATEIGDPVQRRLAPIRINLLPHREMRRERRKKDFVGLIVLTAIAGAVTAFAGGMAINQQISSQQERNDYITAENAKLDVQIVEIKTLRAEIAGLGARQKAVEDLQSDRTVPVHLFDELVRLAPEGIYLRSLRQEDARVTMIGHAQTNERVAELLRNLSDRSAWLERPELAEIKEISVAPLPGQKEARRLFEFSLNALIKRPAVSEQKPGAARPTTDAGGAPASGRAEPVKVGALR